MGENYAVVVGAVNVDIWGRSYAPLLARDSNPGEIRVSPGGVGRNIAHNLRLLGTEVEMLTVLGGDHWAAQIEESCRRLGIGLSRALRAPEGRTSCYLSVSGPDGDMAVAVCDTEISGYLTPEVLDRNLDLLCGASLVVFDGNLTEEAIGFLTERCTAPLFADPVSVTKSRKLLPFLHRIHTLKPNAQEACALTGISDPGGAAEALVRSGVGHAFVSDGENGMYAAWGEGSAHVPCRPARLVNANGGGDAAMAALCMAFLEGGDPMFAARCAMAAGALTVESGETIQAALSRAAVLERMEA